MSLLFLAGCGFDEASATSTPKPTLTPAPVATTSALVTVTPTTVTLTREPTQEVLREQDIVPTETPTMPPSPTRTETLLPAEEERIWLDASTIEQARNALVEYFDALSAGHYEEVIAQYSGSYENIRSWNPDVPAEDKIALLQTACERQLRCLSIRKVVSHQVVSPTAIRFTVQFTAEDGSLFTRGPCCGATEEEIPPQSEFKVTVQQAPNGMFAVNQLGIYVP